VRLGVILPSFQPDPEAAIAVALRAEAAGLDGVFAYDHLFPAGRPDRPALSCLALLAAVALRTKRIGLGPLAVRVGVLPDRVLLASLLSLSALAPGRLIVALGVGDAASLPEHHTYGIARPELTARLESLEAIGSALGDAGIEVWVASGSARLAEVARRRGLSINLWEADPAVVAKRAELAPVTWAGTLGPDPGIAQRRLTDLREAGALFVVDGSESGIDLLTGWRSRSV